jgi:hypothetical protein
MKNTKGSTSAQVAEPSTSKKSAKPANSNAPQSKSSTTKPAKAKVKEENTKVIAEVTKERIVIYNYPEDLTKGKSTGEQQRKKKEFRQGIRTKVRSMLKHYKAAKKSKDEKAVKEAKVALKAYAKEHLTPSGFEKFELVKIFAKAPKETVS